MKFLKIKKGAELFRDALVPVHAIIDLGPNGGWEERQDRQRYLWLITLPKPLVKLRPYLLGVERNITAMELKQWYDFHHMSGTSFTLSYVEAYVYRDKGSHYADDLIWIRSNEPRYVEELDLAQLDNGALVKYLEEME